MRKSTLQRTRWASAGFIFILACSQYGSGPGLGPDPCANTGDGGAPDCSQACDQDVACPSGTYCADGRCKSDCTPESALDDCGANESCDATGRCQPSSASGGQNNGTNGSTGGDPPNGTGGENTCAEVSVVATPKTPNVVLIIDQSGSMEESFGTQGSRWDALKSSLLANDGLIAELQGVVRFGLALYSGEEGACPLLTEVDVALDNLEGIRARFANAEPIDETPTGDAIDAILTGLVGQGVLAGKDPTVFVLATDGEPDTCEQPNPQEGQAESIAAVKRALSLGVRTYVIAVADEEDLSQEHLRDLANAGAGVSAGQPDALSYRVQNDQGLRDSLRTIVQSELSCAVTLEGTVTSTDPCVGRVTLDGNELACGGANGWVRLDASTIELRGTACTALKSGATLQARFPCDSVSVL